MVPIWEEFNLLTGSTKPELSPGNFTAERLPKPARLKKLGNVSLGSDNAILPNPRLMT